MTSCKYYGIILQDEPGMGNPPLITKVWDGEFDTEKQLEEAIDTEVRTLLKEDFEDAEKAGEKQSWLSYTSHKFKVCDCHADYIEEASKTPYTPLDEDSYIDMFGE